ncbi:MAG: hypothetical protein U1F57_09685 [bacterium]
MRKIQGGVAVKKFFSVFLIIFPAFISCTLVSGRAMAAYDWEVNLSIYCSTFPGNNPKKPKSAECKAAGTECTDFINGLAKKFSTKFDCDWPTDQLKCNNKKISCHPPGDGEFPTVGRPYDGGGMVCAPSSDTNVLDAFTTWLEVTTPTYPHLKNKLSSACAQPVCGDHFLDAGEACDGPAGPTGDFDPDKHTCSSDCKTFTTCGDGKVEGAEQCDGTQGKNGPLENGATCAENCLYVKMPTQTFPVNPVCGNGVKEKGEACDYKEPEFQDPNAESLCSKDCKTLTHKAAIEHLAASYCKANLGKGSCFSASNACEKFIENCVLNAIVNQYYGNDIPNMFSSCENIYSVQIMPGDLQKCPKAGVLGAPPLPDATSSKTGDTGAGTGNEKNADLGAGTNSNDGTDNGSSSQLTATQNQTGQDAGANKGGNAPAQNSVPQPASGTSCSVMPELSSSGDAGFLVVTGIFSSLPLLRRRKGR